MHDTFNGVHGTYIFNPFNGDHLSKILQMVSDGTPAHNTLAKTIKSSHKKYDKDFLSSCLTLPKVKQQNKTVGIF